MRAGIEPATDDQGYLDQLFDHIVELIEDGRPVADLSLEQGREHLRAQVDRLIRLAQGVALGRGDPLPRIAGYTILSELGRGGMGIVYLAQQEKLGGRLVAIKLLLDGAWASGKQRRRFEREAELVAALRHPNIVRLYDSGLTEDRFPYYVMEYVEGTGLQDWSSGSTDTSSPNWIPDGLPADSPSASVRDAAEMVAKISEAVGYAHQRGTIHRDLKPSNILVDPTGEPHVLDFGLAKLVSDKAAGGSSARMSQTGEFMGSLPWASPEQAEGALDRIDVRTDVYSLGVMTFRLLTGRSPYAVTGSFGQVLDNIQHAEPPRPSKLRPGLDDEIDTIVLKCLAKEPDRRYQTAGELARDLRRYLTGDPIEAKRDSVAYMLRKQLRRYRVAMWVAALLVTVTSIATVVSVSFEREATKERVEAQYQAMLAQAINKFMLETLASPDPYANQFAIDALRDVTVAEALDTASEKVQTAFVDRPLIEAGVRDTLGATYLHLGLLNSADTHLTRALELRRDLLGDDHVDTLTSLAHLAELRLDQGEMEESEALWRRAWEGRRELLGGDHPDTLTAKDYTALTLSYQMEYDEAERLTRECLADRRRVLGSEHRDTLHTLNNLGVLLIWRARYAEAQPLIQEVYRCYERDLGPEHLYAASVLLNVATLHSLSGEYDQAAELFRLAYERQLSCSGEEHPNTLSAQCMLGQSLIRLGCLDEAELLLTGALEAKRRVQGERHWETLSIQFILADLRNAQGKPVEAEELLRPTLAVQLETLGENHFRTLRSETRLGRVLITLDRLEEAETLLRRALQSVRDAGREEHPFTLQTMVQLARALRHQGHNAQAAVLLDEALGIAKSTLDVDHPITLSARTERGMIDLAEADPASAAAVFEEVVEAHRERLGDRHAETLTAMNLLGRALLDQGHATEACEILREVEVSARMVLLSGHWLSGEFAGDLGRCLTRVQDYTEAEELLLRAHAELADALGSKHSHTRRVAESLAELYEATGQVDEAAVWRDRAAEDSVTE